MPISRRLGNCPKLSASLADPILDLFFPLALCRRDRRRAGRRLRLFEVFLPSPPSAAAAAALRPDEVFSSGGLVCGRRGRVRYVGNQAVGRSSSSAEVSSNLRLHIGPPSHRRIE